MSLALEREVRMNLGSESEVRMSLGLAREVRTNLALESEVRTSLESESEVRTSLALGKEVPLDTRRGAGTSTGPSTANESPTTLGWVRGTGREWTSWNQNNNDRH